MGNILQGFLKTRSQTESLCYPLAIEDYVVQSMADVSPPKWHLAHTTWFFDQCILKVFEKDYRPYHPDYHFMFNSYYQSFSKPFTRGQRGVLSRPTVVEILDYRQCINEKIAGLLEKTDGSEEINSLMEIGIHHEMQHQELLLMDIQHIFSVNPLYPIYNKDFRSTCAFNSPPSFISFEGGVVDIGHQGKSFCYDNELPYHKQYVNPFQIADRLVTNGEYLAFVQDKGYQQHGLWLSDAWDLVQTENWEHPLYWHDVDGQWFEMTLTGLKQLDLSKPVSHVSFYEADAFARWSDKRLPSEFEWEHAAPRLPHIGNLWEWTSSAYHAYPGYQRSKDALGEYNGKFMSNQMVLRGHSFVTPEGHGRLTYRNFFQPEKQWQFSGIRLANDC